MHVPPLPNWDDSFETRVDRSRSAISASRRGRIREEGRGEHRDLRQVAADYIASHSAGWRNSKHADQWSNTLAKYAEPVIPVVSPRPVMTEHVLKSCRRSGRPKSENR